MELNVNVHIYMICMIFYKFKDSYIFFNKTNKNVMSLIKIYIYTINISPNILSKFDKDWYEIFGDMDLWVVKYKLNIFILYKFKAIYIVFNKIKTIALSLMKLYMFNIFICSDILLNFDKCCYRRMGNIDPMTNTLKIRYNMKMCISRTEAPRVLYFEPN